METPEGRELVHRWATKQLAGKVVSKIIFASQKDLSGEYGVWIDRPVIEFTDGTVLTLDRGQEALRLLIDRRERIERLGGLFKIVDSEIKD